MQTVNDLSQIRQLLIVNDMCIDKNRTFPKSTL